MTIIYVAENNCECLAVTFQNKGWIRVQKMKKYYIQGLKMNILYTRSILWKHL